MLVDDTVDVGLIAIAVPNAFRIDDDDRAFGAPVEAPRPVDSDLAGSVNAKRLAPFFGVVAHRPRAMILTAGIVLSLVDAEEGVSFVMRHRVEQVARQNFNRFLWRNPSQGTLSVRLGVSRR